MRRRNGSALHAHGHPGSVNSLMRMSATPGTYPVRPSPNVLAEGDGGAARVAPGVIDDDVGGLAVAQRAVGFERAVARRDLLHVVLPAVGVERHGGGQLPGDVQPVAEPAVEAVVLGVGEAGRILAQRAVAA